MQLNMDLSDKQLEIIEACEIGNGIRYVLACTGRQVGKTTTAMLVAYDWCTTNSDVRVGFMMPSYGFCKKVWKDLKKALAPLIGIKAVTFIGSPLNITFSNGSEIRFFTAENESCRGETFDMLIVDEAVLISDYIWGILKPAVNNSFGVTLDNGNPFGKVLIVSTPKKRNFFYTLMQDQSDTTYKVRYTTEEAGLCPIEEIEKDRLSLAPEHFRNEYMGEFSDGNGLVFNFKDCVRDNDVTDLKGVSAALDIGGKIDSTVLTIQNKNGDVILSQGWVQEWSNLIVPIITLLKQYGSPICYVETNGVGETPYVELRNKYGKTKPWRTTGTSKPAIIEKLIYDFNLGAISIPREEDLLDELESFETKESSNGNRKFGAPHGKHDDKVMSLAICNYHRTKVKSVKPVTIRKSNERRM